VAAACGLPYARGGTEFLAALNAWLPPASPRLQGGDLGELALLCGTDYTKELRALFELQRATFLAGAVSPAPGARSSGAASSPAAPCRTFARTGSCSYGSRCHFLHQRPAAGRSAAAREPLPELRKLVQAGGWLASWLRAGNSRFDSHPDAAASLGRSGAEVAALRRAIEYARRRVSGTVVPLEDRPVPADGRGALPFSQAETARLLCGVAAERAAGVLASSTRLWCAVEQSVISGDLGFSLASSARAFLGGWPYGRARFADAGHAGANDVLPLHNHCAAPFEAAVRAWLVPPSAAAAPAANARWAETAELIFAHPLLAQPVRAVVREAGERAAAAPRSRRIRAFAPQSSSPLPSSHPPTLQLAAPAADPLARWMGRCPAVRALPASALARLLPLHRLRSPATPHDARDAAFYAVANVAVCGWRELYDDGVTPGDADAATGAADGGACHGGAGEYDQGATDGWCHRRRRKPLQPRECPGGVPQRRGRAGACRLASTLCSGCVAPHPGSDLPLRLPRTVESSAAVACMPSPAEIFALAATTAVLVVRESLAGGGAGGGSASAVSCAGMAGACPAVHAARHGGAASPSSAPRRYTGCPERRWGVRRTSTSRRGPRGRESPPSSPHQKPQRLRRRLPRAQLRLLFDGVLFQGALRALLRPRSQGISRSPEEACAAVAALPAWRDRLVAMLGACGDAAAASLGTKVARRASHLGRRALEGAAGRVLALLSELMGRLRPGRTVGACL